MLPSVLISARGEERVRHGHPWIYKADVMRADVPPGSVVGSE